ncbi:MAG: hypothetical protein WC758_08245 [Candidatus Woesearchaeota archaeon]|jgi:sulfur transfer protein SufE
MENKKETNRYVIKIGKLLREVLDKQKEKINNVTYGCVVSSDYEAGEIIAKKVIEKKLI